jgi:ribonuclease-3
MDRRVVAVSETSPTPASLAEVLGYAFRDPGLARTALTHPSWANEMDGSAGNERLEFLGDAVLDLVIAHELYAVHPEWAEGELTRARAALVNQQALAEIARTLGLGRLVLLGRTEQRSGGADKDRVLANCLEALIGAVFLDGGLEPAHALLRRLFASALESGRASGGRDPKTAFQEWAHARHRTTPRYETVADSGIDDDAQRFRVEVRIGDETWGEGSGRSKRSAERAAALAALARAGGDGG